MTRTINLGGGVQLVVPEAISSEEVTALRSRVAELERDLASQQGDGSVNWIALTKGDSAIVHGSVFWKVVSGVPVMLTALHNTDSAPDLVRQLLALYEQRNPRADANCYRLKRPAGTDQFFIDGAYADVHIIGPESAVREMKAECPSIRDFEEHIGWDAGNMIREPSAAVMIGEGYPAGAQSGQPERRHLSPYVRFDRVGGVYGFWSSLSGSEYVAGAVRGGFSGGRASTNDPRFFGVVVRGGPDFETGREVAGVALLHSDMTLEPA